MKLIRKCQSALFVSWLVVALSACSTGPQVTRTQELLESADAPYENILVITLYSSFDSRRYLEKEVVNRLAELGTRAVASTSLMDSRTPATRKTFLEQVEAVDADAVLVTHLIDLDTKVKMVDMSPEASYSVRSTNYFNVFSVELEEFVEPQAAKFNHSLVLGTALYSASSQDIVWAIEASSKISPGVGNTADYSIYLDEANAIVEYLSRDGLISD